MIDIVVVAIAPEPLRHVEWITCGKGIATRVPVLITDPPTYIADTCRGHVNWMVEPCAP